MDNKKLGNIDETSPMGKDILQEEKTAEQALLRADVTELFAIYEKMCIERAKHMDVIETLSKHFSGSSDKPRYGEPSESTIVAMQAVALAAIDLAKQVALGKAV